MKSPLQKKSLAALALVFIILCFIPGGADAQDIVIRQGDRLELEVPQRQELGRRLTVDDDGQVFLPIIGNILVLGMTINEAETILLTRLREVYPSVQRITLQLLGEEARRLIYVHGQVVSPGKFEFQTTPNVWEAVREAGGTTPNASLETVLLIRAEGEGKRTVFVNLQQAIDTGNFGSLPLLKPGDTVIVPEASVRYTGSGAVRLIGAVTNPSPYSLTGDKTLVDALLAAGGPTEDANLERVNIIRRLPEGGVMTLQVDFSRYLERGDVRHNPAVLPDDTIHVPKQSNYVRVIFTDPRFLLGIVTAAATLAALLTR